MSRRALKLVFAAALWVAAWSAPVPSEAIPNPLYLTCDSHCCWGGGTATSQCKYGGVVMTCGQWWQGYECP
jgi:hypothetical protein